MLFFFQAEDCILDTHYRREFRRGLFRSGNRPFYAAIGVDRNGRRDVLGLWAGTGGGESAKFWMNVLTDLKNRGVRDVFFVVCDGLKGLPDAVNTVFPAARSVERRAGTECFST